MQQDLSLFTEPITQEGRFPWATQPLPKRQYKSAWGVSCAIHGLAVILALWGGEAVLESPRPPIRLVFVEPPSPPPAPFGASTMVGPVSLPEQPLTAVETKPQVQAQQKTSERLKIVKKKQAQEKLRPVPQVPSAPSTAVLEPQPVADAVHPGVAVGAPSGADTGVVGGVDGGQTGGVIGGQGGGPLPVNQVANPPQLLSRVMPDYPRQARRHGVEGLVLLEAILDLEGRIEDEIKVLQSVPLLDDAAMQALRRWRFRPARDHTDQPVRVVLEVPVHFVLK